MMNHVLVAIDDSAPSFAAAKVAIELALQYPLELTFTTVEEAGIDVTAALDHARKLAADAGIVVDTTRCQGAPAFEALLDEAHRICADTIIMGRSDNRRPGNPYVGSQTEHLLEFTDIPVLVVPTAN